MDAAVESIALVYDDTGACPCWMPLPKLGEQPTGRLGVLESSNLPVKFEPLGIEDQPMVFIALLQL